MATRASNENSPSMPGQSAAAYPAYLGKFLKNSIFVSPINADNVQIVPTIANHVS